MKTSSTLKTLLALPLVALLAAQQLIVPALAFRLGNTDLLIKTNVVNEYNDNVTSSESNEIDDLITRLGVGVDWILDQKTRIMSLSGDIKRNTFWDNSDFDNTSAGVDFSWQQELSQRDRFVVRESFSVAEEPLSFDEALGRDQGIYQTLHNSASIEYTREILRQLALRGRYSNDIYEIDRDGSQDSVVHGAGLDGIYYFSSQLNLLLGYEFINRSFESDTDSYTHNVAAEVQRYFTPTFYLTVRAGMDLIESFDGRDYTRPMINATLTREFGERTKWDVSFMRRYSSTTFAQSLFDTWRLSSNIRHQFTERLRGSASAYIGSGEYISIDREDDLLGGRLGLEYDLTRDWRCRVDYGLTTVDSSVATREYTRNKISVGLTYSF